MQQRFIKYVFDNRATLQTLLLILMQMRQLKKNVFQQFMILRVNKVILLMEKVLPAGLQNLLILFE